MLNALMMYGGKKSKSLGIGQEFDFDSLHVPHAGSTTEVDVTPASRAFALVRCPPKAKWSPLFRHRYSLSVWICPHKWLGVSYSWFSVPYLAAFQSTSDHTHLTDYSNFMISQMNPSSGAYSARENFLIGHGDGHQNHKRSYSIERLAWTHLFITVDLAQTIPADRQKVWINGALTAGTTAPDLEPVSQSAQYPANPFLSRDFAGGHATYIPDTSPDQENLTLALGAAPLFWNHRQKSLMAPNFPQASGSIAALYFIDDTATVDQIAEHDPITNIWTQKPLLPVFGNASFYLNFENRSGPVAGENTDIAKDQLGNTLAVAVDAQQNVSGKRNTFRGKAEHITYPQVR